MEIGADHEAFTRGGLELLAGPRRKQNPDRGIVGVFVVLRHLVGREGGATTGAVGLALMALDQQALLVELGKGPPGRFDVGVGEGEVGVVEIQPISHPLRHQSPLALVGLDAFEAGLVEGGDAVSLNVLLARETQALFDLDFNRKAVGVPARLSRHVVTLHGAKAGEKVFDHPSDHVTDMGHVVGGRWPLEENETGLIGRLSEALLEDAQLAPALQGLHLKRREGIPGGYFGEGSLIH
jgi:hypothetical protein